jgi:hypothetical protein
MEEQRKYGHDYNAAAEAGQRAEQASQNRA